MRKPIKVVEHFAENWALTLLEESGFDLFWKCVKAWEPCTPRVMGRALADIFWDSTNTFHLPVGEMAITPVDFVMITGLRWGGQDVEFDPVVPDQVMELLELVLERRRFGRKMKLSYGSFEDVITSADFTHMNEFQRRFIFLAYFISATMFANQGDDVYLTWMKNLLDLEQVIHRNWAKAAYANFIRWLRFGVRPGTDVDPFFAPENPREMSGPSMWKVLEVWGYEYIKGFTIPTRHAKTVPAAERWHKNYLEHKKKPFGSLNELRRILDHLEEDDVNWNAWVGFEIPQDFIPSRTAAHRDSTLRLVMESPSGWVWSLGERLTRQTLGHERWIIPSDPPETMHDPRALHAEAFVAAKRGSWYTNHASMASPDQFWEEWEQYRDRLAFRKLGPYCKDDEKSQSNSGDTVCGYPRATSEDIKPELEKIMGKPWRWKQAKGFLKNYFTLKWAREKDLAGSVVGDANVDDDAQSRPVDPPRHSDVHVPRGRSEQMDLPRHSSFMADARRSYGGEAALRRHGERSRRSTGMPAHDDRGKGILLEDSHSTSSHYGDTGFGHDFQRFMENSISSMSLGEHGHEVRSHDHGNSRRSRGSRRGTPSFVVETGSESSAVGGAVCGEQEGISLHLGTPSESHHSGSRRQPSHPSAQYPYGMPGYVPTSPAPTVDLGYGTSFAAVDPTVVLCSDSGASVGYNRALADDDSSVLPSQPVVPVTPSQGGLELPRTSGWGTQTQEWSGWPVPEPVVRTSWPAPQGWPGGNQEWQVPEHSWLNAGSTEVLHLSGSGGDTEVVDSSYYQWDTYFGAGGSGAHGADSASGGGGGLA